MPDRAISSVPATSGYPQVVLGQFHQHGGVIAGCFAFALLAHDLGVGDAVGEGR
jgi:hypothetical protein